MYSQQPKLKPENCGSQSHLSESQTAELIAYLTDNLLPTTAAIISVIEEGLRLGNEKYFVC